MFDLSSPEAAAVYADWRIGLSEENVLMHLKRNSLGSYPKNLDGIRNPKDLTALFWRRNVTLFETAARKEHPTEVPCDPLAFWEFELRCYFIGVDMHVGTNLRVYNKARHVHWP